MKSALCLAVLLVACGGSEDVPAFPRHPPRWYRVRDARPSARQLAALAETGARDCGVAVDRSSADRVYTCAAASLARRRPFFCSYEPPPPPVVDDVGRSSSSFDASPARVGGVWAWPAAFIGTSRGIVYAVRQTGAETFARGTPVLIPDAASPPQFLGTGMTVPEPVGAATATLPPRTAAIAGIVLVEVTIDSKGRVARSRVIKPLPLEVDRRAEELVRQTEFRPSRRFGVPVAVISIVSVEVRGGKAAVRR